MSTLGAMFVVAERGDDGETFVSLVDGAPDWLYAACRDLHDDEMPNDWRWSTCRDIAVVFDEQGPGEDFAIDCADSLTDQNTWDLVSWLRDNLHRVSLVDDAYEDLGWTAGDGVVSMIRLGQFETIRDMAERFQIAVVDAIESGDWS